VVGGLTACTSAPPAVATGPVDVARPAVTGAAVDAACARLLAALPHEVDPGVARRPARPDAAHTAAWGDPPVTLECGVAPPDPNDAPLVVNGVGFTVHDVGPATRWTTYGRTVLAAVTVPDHYQNGIELIYPLAAPVAASLPVDPAAPPLVGASGSPAP
jgi:hypothetical protein